MIIFFMKEHKTYKSKWYEFTPTWSGFHLSYHLAGYFHSIPMLQIYFIWGKLFLYLPWRHYKKVEIKKNLKEIRKDKLNFIKGKEIKKVYKKELYNENDPPRYGIYFHMNEFCINYGKKYKQYDLPWCLDWIRTSALTKDGKWLHETKHNRNMNFQDEDKWKDILFSETYPYIYITQNNEEQQCLATIRVEEREWRWHWFKWLKYPRRISKDIDIEFSDEIGERKGSWKGGVTGCGYEMKPNETPYETLKRMEKERKFK